MNEKGFTLIEMIAVMVILGVVAVIAIPKFIHIDDKAEAQALLMGVNELNDQEKLLWSKFRLGYVSYTDEELDAVVFADMDVSLGQRYKWSGNSLSFGSASVTLERLPATNKDPAKWQRK